MMNDCRSGVSPVNNSDSDIINENGRRAKIGFTSVL